MLREQYMLRYVISSILRQAYVTVLYLFCSVGRGTSNIRKEGSNWSQNMNIPEVPQQNRPGLPNNASLTAEQIQAQLLMSMAKSQGLDRDPNNIDQLHTLFQRQVAN
jgi:hypothetical protein